jgi:pimeloyl-ACP methyl ester carboxylesterase
MALRFVETPQAIIAVEEHGPADGRPVILLHGFPYSARGYDAVAAIMAGEGHRVVVPHLRGYGETRLKPGVMLSGAQGALGADLLALMDAMAIPSAILAGYDWGGRAACIVAALHPERCAGLVSCTGYNIQDINRSAEPAAPDREMRHWYQYYFHGERGARGLAQNRREIGRLLWEQWSPDWRFSEAEFAASAAHWDNEDYAPVVIQSYRHRFGLAPGDPAHEEIEAALAKLPPSRCQASTFTAVRTA